LEALENYNGTPFLPSDSDILLDSADHDDIGDFDSPLSFLVHFEAKRNLLTDHAHFFPYPVEYFADAINGYQSDEEK
jgi:alpha/beta superfamily hydrolase